SKPGVRAPLAGTLGGLGAGRPPCYVRPAMRSARLLSETAAEVIRQVHGVEQPPLLRPTQDPKLGDYQSNAARPLAKALGKAPRDRAGPIAERMPDHPAISRAEVAGPGFVNLRLDDRWLAGELDRQLGDRTRDGVDLADDRRRIVVDFSSPNIAKQMHV